MSKRTLIKVTRIINACTLIQIGEHNILTDPFFLNWPFIGIQEPLSMTVEELPKLTAIIGCHTFVDHFQMKGLSKYPHNKDDVKVYVPMKAMVRRSRKAGFNNVEIVDWGNKREIVEGLSLDVVAAHKIIGMRVNNYVLKSGSASVFFGSEARDIQPLVEYMKNNEPIDVTVLPTNAVHLFGLMKIVMGGADAVEATKALGSKNLFVIHDAHPSLPFLIVTKSSGVDADRAAALDKEVNVIRLATGRTWESVGNSKK